MKSIMYNMDREVTRSRDYEAIYEECYVSYGMYHMDREIARSFMKSVMYNMDREVTKSFMKRIYIMYYEIIYGCGISMSKIVYI